MTYADTAYNSQRPRELPPEPKRDEGYLMRVARGQRINLPTGAHCREHRPSIQAQDNALKTIDLSWYEKENRGPHRMLFWPYFFEWPVLTRSLQYVVAWFTFPGGIGGSIFITIFISIELGFYSFIYAFLPLFAIWYLLRHINKREPKLKKDTRFYRRTGMVSLYMGKNTPRQEIPFDEFDPYMTFRTGPSGSTSFVLQLSHRYSETIIGHPKQFNEAYDVYLAWEQLQQFMDISQPLPDTMETEPFRHLDPVTAEHDRRTGRREDYWRSIFWRDLLKRNVIAADAAKDYPWGQTREQALAEGWKPSEQRWQEQQDADTSSITE